MAGDGRVDADLLLEVALSLLPLLGRCVQVDGDRAVRQHGSRLDDVRDRRALVLDVARCWQALGPGRRGQYPRNRAEAIAAFAVDYVEAVEASVPDEAGYRAQGHDVSVERLWREHAAAIRRGDVGVVRLVESV